MPAEYECSVCHWPIFDAAAPHPLSSPDRVCFTCCYLADWAPADAEKARLVMNQPIMPEGFGRAELRRMYPERAHGSPPKAD